MSSVTHATPHLQVTAIGKRQRKKAPEGARTITIKTSFSTIVRLPRLQTWLIDACAFATRAYVESTRLANLHVVRMLELDPHCSTISISQTFFGQCIQLVTRRHAKPFGANTKCNNDALLQTYVQEYWPLAQHLPPNHIDSFSRFGEAMARQLTTNAKVYLRTTFLKRHRAWCIDTARVIAPLPSDGDSDMNIDAPKLSAAEKQQQRQLEKEQKSQRWKLVTWLFQQTIIEEDFVLDIEALSARAQAHLAANAPFFAEASIAQQLAAAASQCRRRIGPRPVTYAALVNQNTNGAYLPWMYHLLCQREQHNASANADVKQKRLFSMLPQSSLDPHYVSLSSTGLFEWLFQNRDHLHGELHDMLLGTQKQARATFFTEENRLKAWHLCFNINAALDLNRAKRKKSSKELRHCEPKMAFACNLATDGVGVSMTMHTHGTASAASREPTGVLSLNDDDAKSDTPIPIVPLNNCRVIAIDPGKRDLFCAVERVPNQAKSHVKSFSSRTWLERCGATRAQTLRKKWQTPELDAWLLAMPTRKTSHVSDLRTHLQHLFSKLEQYLAHNGRKRVRRLRWGNYMKRQRALDTMANELVASPKSKRDRRQKVIVFGAANFGSNAPVKRLRATLQRRRDVRFVGMDEFKTSQLCNRCAFDACNVDCNDTELFKVCGPLGRPQTSEDGSTQRRRRIHGVRICPNCRMTWNRDVNAALNMLSLFEHAQEHGGERHWAFCRGGNGNASNDVVSTCKRARKRAKTVARAHVSTIMLDPESVTTQNDRRQPEANRHTGFQFD